MKRTRYGHPTINEIVRRLRHEGHAISCTTRGHVRIRHSETGEPLFLSGTPRVGARVTAAVRSWQRRNERRAG